MSKRKKFVGYGIKAVQLLIVLIFTLLGIHLLRNTVSKESETYTMTVIDADAHLEMSRYSGTQHVYSVYLCDTDNLLFMSIESEDLYVRTYDHISEQVQVELTYLKVLGARLKYSVSVTSDWIEKPVEIASGKVKTNQ